MTNAATSFYIPRMRGTWTTDQVKQTIEQNLRMGTIDRVDFGDFVPVGQTDTRSGFLHMAFVDPTWANWLKQHVETTGHARLQITEDEFWMLIPNRNPLPNTHLNIHQLAEITRNQSQRIVTLEATIQDFAARADVQEARINALMARLNAIPPAMPPTIPAETDAPLPIATNLPSAISAPEQTPMDIQQDIILPPPVVNPMGHAFLNIVDTRINTTNAEILVNDEPLRNPFSQHHVTAPYIEAILTHEGRAALDRMQMSAHFCGNH